MPVSAATGFDALASGFNDKKRAVSDLAD